MALLGLADLLELASQRREPIEMTEMTPDMMSKARFLYSLLVQVSSGKAIAIVRLAPMQNGFEAWRQLQAEYSPVEPSRAVAMPAGLLNPRWDPARPFMEQLLIWERQVLAYDAVAELPLTDATKRAVVLRSAPPMIKNFLRKSTQDLLGNYESLKLGISVNLARGRVFDSTGGNTAPMEIDFVTKGDPKGRGKGKSGKGGGGRGRAGGANGGGKNSPLGLPNTRPARDGPQGRSQAVCLNCGGNHWARGCPYPRAQQYSRLQELKRSPDDAGDVCSKAIGRAAVLGR